MYELIQTGSCSFYIDCPSKIGIYKQNDTDVYLIDSGNGKDTAKKVKKIVDSNGWCIKGIINTHSHADHIGGNKYMQQNTGCKIFASDVELAFVEHPILESSFLYGGDPHKDLKHKFLLAEESRALPVSHNDFPCELEIIPLPGHSFNMIGVLTPDGTFFVGDAVSSALTLEKYKISFLCDVNAFLHSLDTLKNANAKIFVPSHAEPVVDISESVELNRRAVETILADITGILADKMTFEELLKKLFDKYGLLMNAEQYVLIGSTVRSYLSYLYTNNMIAVSYENNKMMWFSC